MTERSDAGAKRRRSSAKKSDGPADHRLQAEWIDVTGFIPVTAATEG